MKRKIRTGIVCLMAALSLVACSKKTGWLEENGHTYYYLEDGTAASGWVEIEGSQYYFGSEGLLEHGFRDVDGVTYYFRADGSRASGWVDLEGRRYYLRQSGSLVTGWLSLEGQRYYLTAEGALSGICRVDGREYLFDPQGRLTSGWLELDGQMVYGDRNGHPVTGWQTIDGRRYYFRQDGTLQTGWAEIDGLTYRFREDGTPVQGITPEGQFASNGQLVRLVNPWNSVPEDYELRLVTVEGLKVDSTCSDALLQMMYAARDAKLTCVLNSTYRDMATQTYLWNRRYNDYISKGYSEEEAYRLSARRVAYPGTSEHHTGLAIDITGSEKLYQWFRDHAWEYGFTVRYKGEKEELTGIKDEPWHLRYVGKEVAQILQENDWCLEEFLNQFTT